MVVCSAPGIGGRTTLAITGSGFHAPLPETHKLFARLQSGRAGIGTRDRKELDAAVFTGPVLRLMVLAMIAEWQIKMRKPAVYSDVGPISRYGSSSSSLAGYSGPKNSDQSIS
jgi:hypothetical protein